ncbi:MAG TPA: MBL fold metallo-hydrolase [Anaerolineales bacterium]|nr:MBL fold metallo-hydrolase [Anaerolineales bacterium]
MHRERVSENVYWFQSDIYAQVTAGVVVGPKWSVLIDTLALPEETFEIHDFVERHLQTKIRYIINTHYHADHSWGNCFFQEATIIAHSRCRELLIERGIPALSEAKKESPIFKQVEIVLPHITLDNGELTLKIGKKHLKIMSAPGHSEDGVAVFVVEDRVLFAGDVLMPIPYLLDGDIKEMRATYEKFHAMTLENIVQGHGEVILRGEVAPTIDDNLNYLNILEKTAKTALRRKDPMAYLAKQDVEKCGKSRIALGGLAEELHRQNLDYVYHLTLEKAKIK